MMLDWGFTGACRWRRMKMQRQAPHHTGEKENGMTPGEAIRSFERKLVGRRTIAASEQAFERYAKDVLPVEGPDEAFLALVHQGFEAGYDAAMDAVRNALLEVQSEVLRS